MAVSINRETMFSMYKPVSVVLLSLVLVALISDILVRSRSVYAQSSLPPLYITQAPRRAGENGKSVMVKGREVIGFSCEPATCYILSK